MASILEKKETDMEMHQIVLTNAVQLKVHKLARKNVKKKIESIDVYYIV